jgi:hypothetical protein
MSKRSTGSYYWTLLIMLPVAILTWVVSYLTLHSIHDVLGRVSAASVATVAAVLTLAAQDAFYFRLSRP